MREWSGKRYWLVGASEGLGAALAHQLARAGVEVIVSARSQDKLDALVSELPGNASSQVVDVSDSASVETAAHVVGDVDGVVFLAGVYWPMTSQNWGASRAEAMADINFTGAIRVMGSVMPMMQERGSGHLVITGSLSGFPWLCPAQLAMPRQRQVRWLWQKACTRICVAVGSMCSSPIRGSSRHV